MDQSFKQGDYTTTKIHTTKSGNAITLVIEPKEGEFDGMLKNSMYPDVEKFQP